MRAPSGCDAPTSRRSSSTSFAASSGKPHRGHRATPCEKSVRLIESSSTARSMRSARRRPVAYSAYGEKRAAVLGYACPFVSRAGVGPDVRERALRLGRTLEHRCALPTPRAVRQRHRQPEIEAVRRAWDNAPHRCARVTLHLSRSAWCALGGEHKGCCPGTCPIRTTRQTTLFSDGPSVLAEPEARARRRKLAPIS